MFPRRRGPYISDGTRRAHSSTLRLGLEFESWGRHPKGQINKWPHKTLRCPASPRRLKPRYPDTRAKKADVFVGTSFVCLALVSRTTGTSRNGSDQSGIPRIRTQVPPQDSNPSPRLKDVEVALLVPSVPFFFRASFGTCTIAVPFVAFVGSLVLVFDLFG